MNRPRTIRARSVSFCDPPMRSRFGLPLHLEFYTPEALETILAANARQLDVHADAESIAELARRSRPTHAAAVRIRQSRR